MYEWMSDSIERSRKVFNELSLDWDFSFNDPATIEEIEEYESEAGIILPTSYRLFLLKHNGAHLFASSSASGTGTSPWWVNSGIFIFGIYALSEYRKFIYELSEDPNRKSPLPIAYLGYIGTGDFCGLDMDNLIESENPVLDCNPDYSPDEWKNLVIANSFEEWLKKMFNRITVHRSLPEYWFEASMYDGSLSLARTE